MKVIKISVLMLLLSISSTFANDFDFKTFKVRNPHLLNTIKIPSNKGVIRIPEMQSPSLFERIQEEFNDNYEEIGTRLANRVVQGQNGFKVGYNNLGYTYSHDFIDFTVTINRTLAPDLFNLERWIVADEFTVTIDATKLLNNLQSSGAIDITKKQLGYYAGLAFKRKYRFVHFADSYQDGLFLELDKLFFAFKHFTSKSYLEMDDYEFIQKEDSLSVNVGGIATAPLGNGISVGLGAIAKYQKLATMDIQKIAPDEAVVSGEFLRVSYAKESSTTAGIAAVVEADFLKLLKISLLTFEFEYTREEVRKTNLRFTNKDKDDLYSDSYLSRNVQRLLNGRTVDHYFLKPYVVSHENRLSEKKTSKYNILLFGGIKDQKTEHIEVVKDGKIDSFFKHNYKKVQFKQSLLSRLVSALFQNFLKMSSVVNQNASDMRAVSMEYKSKDDLVKDRKRLDISGSSEKLSVKLNRSFFSKDTTGWRKRKYKKHALNLMGKTAGIDSQVKSMMNNNQIRGPFTYNADFQIGKNGIDYLHRLNPKTAYSYLKSICGSKWWSLRNIIGGCRRKLNRTYEKYLFEWAHFDMTYKTYKKCERVAKRRRWRSRRTRRLQKACMAKLSRRPNLETNRQIPLWRFKDFVQTLHTKSKDHHAFYSMFGVRNVFLHGSVKAMRDNGQNFSYYFKSGEFKGLGVVDNYMRDNGMRSPASVLE